MTTYAVLLRGVNVGGHNKVPMAGLRSALSADGFGDVSTYVQSGNVVLTATGRVTAKSVARRVGDVISSEFGVDVPAVAIDRRTLESVVDANPYANEADPTKVHALFLLDQPSRDASERLMELVKTAKARKDSGEDVTLIGPVIYLHTPEGFGLSEVAKTMSGRKTALSATARNWRTVVSLLTMLRATEGA